MEISKSQHLSSQKIITFKLLKELTNESTYSYDTLNDFWLSKALPSDLKSITLSYNKKNIIIIRLY